MRLRNEIDRATARTGTGKRIIQTAGGSKYAFGLRLTQVALDPSFRKLPAPGVISVEEHRAIMRRCAWL